MWCSTLSWRVSSQAAELFEITQDQNWTDPSWADEEEWIPALLRDLTVSPARIHVASNSFNIFRVVSSACGGGVSIQH